MPELQDRGFNLHVAALRQCGRHYEALLRKGVPTQFIGMRSRTDIIGIARAYRLWRLRPDVVVTSSVDAQVIGHLIAIRAGAPHVTVEHGGSGLPRALHRRLLVRMVAPWVDRVIAVSATQLDELRRLGFPTDRIMVIPNGIPTPATVRSRAAMRTELEIGDDCVLALLVATLRPEKRAEVFIEALRRAHAREPRLRGAIAGGGPQLELVRTVAGTTPNLVHVLGERSDVADLIDAADIVCLTSDFEGLPITVLEAMALSRPLVATRVGGIPEAVTEGRTGKLVVPGDPDAFAEALIALAKAPALRRSMGDAARSTYQERYTLEAMVERYVAVLTDLGGGPGDSGSAGCAPTRSGDSSHA
jgi:glycosyltransferase involved in cell wall biosynthesis